MTLDALLFIDTKGGNAESIRESQRKRGLSAEIVNEVVAMYDEWVKCVPDRTPILAPRVLITRIGQSISS